jgi:hypothetical protein
MKASRSSTFANNIRVDESNTIMITNYYICIKYANQDKYQTPSHKENMSTLETV